MFKRLNLYRKSIRAILETLITICLIIQEQQRHRRISTKYGNQVENNLRQMIQCAYRLWDKEGRPE